MPRRSTPTFIAEVPLSCDLRTDREAAIRLELARDLSNACLGEALKRLDAMRADPNWAVARTMPRTVEGKPNKERIVAFEQVAERNGFTAGRRSSPRRMQWIFVPSIPRAINAARAIAVEV